MQTMRRLEGHPPAMVVARVVPAASHGGTVLRRTGWLTPYAAETIAEDAQRAGRGACLEITLEPRAGDDHVAAVRADFAWLGARGVDVRVRRGQLRRAGRRCAPR